MALISVQLHLMLYVRLSCRGLDVELRYDAICYGEQSRSPSSNHICRIFTIS
jgi:hypothetical protein